MDATNRTHFEPQQQQGLPSLLPVPSDDSVQGQTALKVQNLVAEEYPVRPMGTVPTFSPFLAAVGGVPLTPLINYLLSKDPDSKVEPKQI